MVTNFRIESGSVSDRGLSEKRPQNEDSFIEIPENGIFAVADGVGGAQAGEVASQMAMEILGEAFINMAPASDAEEVMRLALERANSAIFQMSNELSQLSKMATTVVALHIDGNIATIGHVGDSRLYRRDAEGILHRETDDHSMVAEEVRAGRMSEEQAENHPGKNIISRALGAEATVIVDLKTMMIDSDSTFLICSDGVTRHISDSEINELLGTGSSPAEICSEIKDICFDRGAEDNLTAVIVKLTAADVAADTEEPESEVVELPSIPEDDEPTVAAARISNIASDYDDSDDDELLELDTAELTPAERDTFAVQEEPILETEDELELEPTVEPEAHETEELEVEEPTIAEPTYEPAAAEEEYLIEPVAETQDTAVSEPAPAVSSDRFTVFGNTETSSADDAPESTGAFAKVASTVGMLLIGALFGLGAYHYFLLPAQPVVNSSQLTEMKAANIPLSAFEENRRVVDKDPAGYIAKFGTSPQDCEDNYLLGRAYLLTGDFPRSRASLTEARNKLSDADPANAKTLASDIAIAIAVTNDTTIQGILKKELDTGKPASNTAANSNTAK